MANEFYDPGDQRAAKVKALFARVAWRYDLLNDLQSLGLHRYWKRRVLRLAHPKPGERALDLCCGTGDLALGLATLGVDAVGLDFSEQMLRVASGRTTRVQVDASRVTPAFLQGDAQQLPFPDNTFDILTMGYGLRNLADFEAGLREMRRVAKPGGRLLVLDFGKPDNAVWRSVYFGYLRLFVPCLGLVFCGSASAYAYILESLKHYPAQRGVAAKMSELGLANVGIVNMLGGVMSINYAEKEVAP
jgi:demethylmenaquinone methyltransferase/2-methoxy-6-polyprenyl-1,4-benzoquinol methylase